MNSDDTLLSYNHQGLIPGPHEDEEAFLSRVSYCKQLKEKLPLTQEEKDFFENNQSIIDACLKESFPITQSCYDIAPTWIPFLFSNQKLAPWHGGCAWIFQMDDNTPTGSFFQLRQNFKHKTRYLGYSRSELIAHELSHVGRMMFEEPKFEELLAYRTAKSSFRRWFGPIVQSSWESTLFVTTLFSIVGIDLYTVLAYGKSFLHWMILLPLALVIAALGRLWHRQKQFHKCWDNLKSILDDDEKANAVIYRLTDEEIVLFSKLSPAEIRKYIHDQPAESLRWKLIKTAYCQNVPKAF